MTATSDSADYRVGDSFHCEACGHDSILKLERLMDGWTCLGEVLVCAFCGAQASGDDTDREDVSAAGAEAPRAGLDALASFLDVSPEKPGIVLEPEETHFCRDCKHFLRHPFRTRCLLHDRDVEPMDDCEDFDRVLPEGKKEDNNASDEEESDDRTECC